ncbi:MAG: CehA/McbA family metallohydrolase [Chloroflexi bacterium]|nr:CehA/McbA family metallohydrolase [Chloroflexota bacterium]
MRVLDLHVHTSRGAADSNLSPEELVAEARRLGLDGAGLTEHSMVWDRREFQRFVAASALLFLRGMEVETELGHVAVFGLDGYASGMHRARELRRLADRAGGFLIALHPFRGLTESHPPWLPKGAALTPENAASLPLLKLVHAVEAGNGGCTPQENALALAAARRLRLPATAGSDAHSHHGLGSWVTVFPADPRDEAETLAHLRAGRCYPARRSPSGELAPLDGLARP